MRSQHKRLNSILQEKPFYKIKRKFDINNSNKVLYYVFIFDKKKVSQYELSENLIFNSQIFTKCQQIIPGDNLHKIKQSGTAQDGNLHVYVKPYQCRLDQYAQLNVINQYESIQIMKEVIGALYCLYKKQYFCYNVRAQNFVKVQMPNKFGNLGQQKRYKWKLNSVPFGYSYPPKTPQIRSPFTWKEQYQPPEAYTYKRKLTVDQLKQSLVWNIGCIWLQILYGKNVLNNLQSIKKFSLGSGQHGIYNIEALNLKKKLSPQNETLLSKMLAYNEKNRISLKSIFQHKVFGGSINIFYYDTKISPDSGVASQPSLTYKPQLQYDKYEQINQFIAQLIKIINTNNLVPILHQDSAIKVVLKRLKPKKLEELKISQYTPKQIKKSKCQSQILDQNGNPSSFTADNFYKFIKPYKFYYDKTIFLSNCSKVIAQKLKCIQQAKYKKNYQESILHQKNSDLIFNLQFVMISMRLIYLQTIVQNLRLYRNIFTIPNTTFNIQNPNFSNIKAQWQIFSQTALYESLKLFMSIKLNQCQTQLQELLENQNSQRYSRLSEGLLSGIKNVFRDMDYKVCSIPKFLQYFQKALVNVKQVVDQFNVTNKQFKIPMNDREGKWQQNMRYIGYLWMAIFIESPKLFSQEFYYKLFAKYMVIEVKQSEVSFHKINNMNLLTSKYNNSKREPLYDSQKSNQVFNFQSYQQFLRNSDSQNVKDQVQNLIRLFVV